MQKRKKQEATKYITDDVIFVTPDEVASALRRTPTGIRYMLREGLLPGKKVGGRWFMFRRDFEAIITPPADSPA
jgi:hypothetical protein